MKSIKVLSDISSKYKVIIVDEGSPDRSGEIAERLATEYSDKKISIHYGKIVVTALHFRRDLSTRLITSGSALPMVLPANLLHPSYIGTSLLFRRFLDIIKRDQEAL